MIKWLLVLSAIISSSVAYASSGFTFFSLITNSLKIEEHVLGFGVVAALIIIAGLLYRSKLASAPNIVVPDIKTSYRNIVEAFGEFIYNLCRNTMGEVEAKKYFGCIAMLFIFIFLSNLLGLIPGFIPPTDNINTTLALGVFVFIYYNFQGIKEQGLVGHIKHFMGPVWYLSFLIFPI